MELPPLHMPQAKICTGCLIPKDWDDFSNRKDTKDGKNAQCRQCRGGYCARYYLENKEETAPEYARYRIENREKIALAAAQYRKKNLEKIAERLAKTRQERLRKKALFHKEHAEEERQYREEHKEEDKAKAAIYYVKNKPIILARNAQWRRENPEKAAAIGKRRHALGRGSPYSDLSDAQFEEICAAQGHRCYYCKPNCRRCARGKHKLTPDHVIPVSKGGADTVPNIVAVCQSCNSKKHAGKPPIPVQLNLLTEAPPRKRKFRKPKLLKEDAA